MAFSAGMYFENGAGNIVFAEHPNAMLNAQRGNYVVDTSANGGAVTANVSSDLTTTAADIDIADVDTFNNDAINNLSGITSIDLSEAYDDLSAGQSLYVLIYVKANGNISDPSDAGGNEGVGTPATTGQQLPPAIPENSVPLALITLTNGDTTVDSADIEDYRIEGPQGGYFNGLFRIVEGSIIAFDVNETTGHIGIGAAANANYGVFIDAPAEQIQSNQSFDRVRLDDQGAITVLTGTTSPLVTTFHVEEPNIILAGTGAVTTAATIYSAGAPTEASNNYSIFSDAGDIRFDASQVLFNDENDSDVLLFDYDLLNRTIITGASGDTMAWTHWGSLTMNGNIDLQTNSLIFDDGASKTLTATELGYIDDGLGANFANMTNTIWGYLDDVNQQLSTTSSPTFGGLTLNGDLDPNGNDILDSFRILGTTSDVKVSIHAQSNDNSYIAFGKSAGVDDYAVGEDFNGYLKMVYGAISATVGITIQQGGDHYYRSNSASDVRYRFVNNSTGDTIILIDRAPTSASAANMFINSGGEVFESTASSKRYKKNIRYNPDIDTSVIYKLKFSMFDYKAKDNFHGNPNDMIGYIAEDTAEIDKRLVIYEEIDGLGLVPDNIDQRNLLYYTIEELKDHKYEIDKLKNLVNQLVDN